MKKLVGILIFLGLYAGAAFYTGYQGEKNIRHQFALSEQQTEAQGVKLELTRYERGVFFSEVDFVATYPDMNLPFGQFTLTSKSRVQHGPLLFLGGVGAGLFSSVSTMEVSSGDAELNEMLTSLFGESIGKVVTRGHFNNGYTAHWHVPTIEYREEGNSITIDEIHVEMKGHYSGLDMTGDFRVGAVNVALADGSQFTSTPLNGTFDIDNISEAVNIANMEMAIDSITYRSAAMMGGSIAQLKVVQTQKLVNDKIDSFVSFTIDKINGPLEISGLHYDIALNQLDPAAIVKWTEIARKMQDSQADPQNVFADNSEDMAELMQIALQDGLQLKVAIGADFMGGSAKVDWVTDYQALTDGRQLQDIVDPADYLSLFNSDLVIKVSESIVMQTPLVMMIDQYMNTYITREGDQFVMYGSLKNGALKVGNTELPKEMLLALLPSMDADDPDMYDDTDMMDE